MFFGWEKHGDWVAHDYYPPTGGEAFRRGAELARKDGNRIFAFLSGFRFTRKAPRGPREGAFNFEREWEPGEFVIQELDVPHTRPYRPGAIPLFAYLYHEYQAGYSGWSDPANNYPGVDGAFFAPARSAGNDFLLQGRLLAALYQNHGQGDQ